MCKVVQHPKNIKNPLPELLRGVSSHQAQIVKPISNWPQRRQLRFGAVKKFTFFTQKVDKISFEWKSMCFAFSHINNFLVTHSHIPAIFLLDLILSDLSHSKSPQHSITYLQSFETKTETHIILWQSQGNLFHFSQKG